MNKLPPMGNSFILKRQFMGLQEGTELRVHGYQFPRQGDTLTLFATRSGSTSVRVANYYRPILLTPGEIAELMEEVR